MTPVPFLPALIGFYIDSLHSPLAFFNIEFYFLSFIQGLVALGLYGGKVDEYVLSAFLFNKTETLLGIKPFDRTNHSTMRLQKIIIAVMYGHFHTLIIVLTFGWIYPKKYFRILEEMWGSMVLYENFESGPIEITCRSFCDYFHIDNEI